jgi:hypothetical protein
MKTITITRLGRKLSAYTLIVFNSIFNILIAIILNLPQTQLTQIIYGLLRFLTGLTVNLYVIAIVIGNPSEKEKITDFNRLIYVFYFKSC